MTQKEVTNILYNLINDANYIESEIIENKDYRIFKSTNNDEYMVCVLADEENSFNSGVFNTINECYEWIKQNP